MSGKSVLKADLLQFMSTSKLPKFHLSVASLMFRDAFASEVTVEVPLEMDEEGAKKIGGDGLEITDAMKKNEKSATDIYQFASRYCEADSSDNEKDDSVRKDNNVSYQRSSATKDSSCSNSHLDANSTAASTRKTHESSGVNSSVHGSITSSARGQASHCACPSGRSPVSLDSTVSELLTCAVVECIIGNRKFHYTVNADGGQPAAGVQFIEIFVNDASNKKIKNK
jgi:hypothetical protein